MGNKEKGPGKKSRGGRWFKRGLALVAACVVCALAWGYLQPLLTADAVTTYDSAQVMRGNVTTTMSFSATISVRYQEILTNTAVTTVSKLDVTEGAEVKSGDKIIELANGEVLSATMDGTVNEIAVSVGDYLWRSGRQLAQICNLTDLQVDLTVDEYDIQKVKLGQPCTVSIISLGMDYETEIAHIDYVSAATGTVAYYAAVAYLTVPEEVLPGMAATVTLPAEEKQDVLTLALSALSFRDDGTAYVLLKQPDGSFAEQEVETGLSDGMTVEIVSGLTEGQEVWVKTGTATAQSEFTLSALYKAIFGETVVINPESTRSSGKSGTWNSDGARSMGTPTDMTFPEDGTMPEGMTLPEDGTMPEGMTFPEDGTMPEGMTLPEDTASSSGEDTAATDTAADDAAATASPPSGTRPEQGDETGTRPDRGDGTGTRPDGAGGTRPDAAQTTTQDGETEGGTGE